MPIKANGPAGESEEVDRWAGGVGWIAHPEETMRRASHALAADGEVWLVDPLDAHDVPDRIADLGEVAGVVVLLDRHARNAETFARRYDVPVYLPEGVDCSLSVPVERLGERLGDTGYRVVKAVDAPGWTEYALVDGETLVVADALGTVPYFTAPDERLGVHPMLRLTPPRRLREFDPERVLVGHGAGVSTDASAALAESLDGARRRTPRAWLNAARTLL